MNPVENSKPSVRTGFFDRYAAQSLHQGDLGGYRGDPYSAGVAYYAGYGILPRRDDILITEGGGGPRAIEYYMRLFNDSQVIGAYHKLIGEIIQRKWEIIPASDSDDDEEAAEFVRQCLNRMGSNTRQSYGKELLLSVNGGFDQFIHGISESLILGMSAGEICWTRQGKYVVPSEIKIRDPRRFLFVMNPDGSVSPRLITTASPVEGIPLPLRSMIIHRHWAYSSFADPYGSGLGRQIYSLCDFRRTLLSFWLQYADKHTTPTALGKFELGTPPEEVDALFTSLQRLGQETSIVMPEGMTIDMIRSEGNPQVYTELISYIDQQIAFLICGETTVGQETGAVGSYARDQIADSVRMRKAKAFSEELDETLNSTLIRWIVELNFPNAGIPRLQRNFNDLEQKENPLTVVQVLSQLNQLGFVVDDVDWLKEKLEIPSLIKNQQQQMGMPPMGGGMPTMSESEVNKRAIDPFWMLDNNAKSSNFDENDQQDPNAAAGMDQMGAQPPMDGGGGMPPMGGGMDPSGAGMEGMMPPQEEQKQEKSDTEKRAEKIAKGFIGRNEEVGYETIIREKVEGEGRLGSLSNDQETTPSEALSSCYRLLKMLKMIQPKSQFAENWIFELQKEWEHLKALVGGAIGSMAFSELPNEVNGTEELMSLIRKFNLKILKLERIIVEDENWVIDSEEAGYLRYFAPYFEDLPK